MSSFNLRQIEIFRAVMTTGTISGAAQLLFVSQPAVSRLLSHTEQRVGFALFERIKGRLYATPEAKKLFREVEAVYNAVQRVNELATDLSKNRSGILNIVSSLSLGQVLLPRAIAAFRLLHPQVKLTYQCLSYGNLRERVLGGQADLGVIFLPLEHPNLTVTPLCRGRMVAILPPGHALCRRAALTLADLRPYPLIAYEEETPFGAIVEEAFRAAGEPFNPAIVVGSPQNAAALATAGAGVALVDAFSVRALAAAGQLVPRPLHAAPVLQANLVHTRFEPMSQLTQAFVAQLQRIVRDEGFDLDAARDITSR